MTTSKIALVTGASRGLGRSMTQHLTRAGIGVIGTYLNRKDEIDHLVAELSTADVPVAALQLDVRDSAGFPQFAANVRTQLDGFGAGRLDYIAPGAIETDFGGGLVRDNTAGNTALAGAIALGRVGEPDDIGAAVPAILSDALGWANGTRIELSGGQSL